MKCKILHRSKGRLRVHLPGRNGGKLSFEQADMLEYYLRDVPSVTDVTVYDRTGDAVIVFQCGREQVTAALASFTFDAAPQSGPESSGRALNRQYQEKLVGKVFRKIAYTLFLPFPFEYLVRYCLFHCF